jgi:D-alanyl-D-alanine carboxypeptidase/D-alanyl-D-alanine-endopeptidase (penicillin-binding protein 4)
LSQMHITFNGQIRLANAPKNTLLIATESSKPISQLMADTLKPSDNLYADSLFLHAAARLQSYPVNWQAAQTLVKNFLTKQTGIDLSNAVLMDGSGLSRNDRLTPHQTTSLLRFLNERFPLSYEYIAALPVSGRDGTLQKRFKTPAQQDLVRAKTGTMTGIHSLSGYLYTANGHTLAFALYTNKLPGTSVNISGKHRYLIDALCNYFLKQQPSNIGWAQVFSPHGRLQFQQNPTQADLQRRKKASWRRLETVVKQALLNKAVTVIYRGNELVLEDKQSSPNAVWASLQSLRKKYPFAIALASQTALSATDKAQLLWIPMSEDKALRIWTIKEAI